MEVLEEILEACRVLKLDISPSEFYERHMIFPQGSALPGPARYSDSTPYWAEPVNCFSPKHPAKDITIMGPAQMGKSAMVLNAIIIYLISQNPCNILFLTGHSDLTARAMSKLDFALHQCGLNYLIGPTLKKARGGKTGDTAMEKEFRGGNLLAGSVTNHNLLRQNDCMVTIADDLDAGQMAKKDTGSTVDLIKGRTQAFEEKCKRAWVSTPQVKGLSLIEMQFAKSDQRYWNVMCQKCHERIVLHFSIQVDDKHTGGLKWKLDNLGRVIPGSVEYCCQLCAQHFSDSRKYELLKSGIWIPTCEPKELDHYGYGINGLYAPHGMISWFAIAQDWLIANPTGQPRDEKSYQTWKNIKMGELYEPPNTNIKAREIEKNIRNYDILTLPDSLSVRDGNGHIVLLTLAADLGGRYIGDQIKSTYDDARLDWEIVGWSESGASYSIAHGSIGTFTNAYLGKKDEARELWSYDITKPNNVWKVLDSILEQSYGGMRIQIAGIDTGFADHHVFNYIESRAGRFRIVGLKGDKENKPVAFGLDKKHWKSSMSRSNQFILQVGNLKDQLVSRMQLKWDGIGKQPPGFMNFPQRSGGFYEFENYFSHFEAEVRKIDEKKGTFIWEKKSSTVQNHMFDCSVYGMAVREILMFHVFKELGIDPKEGIWRDYCDWILDQWGWTSAL